MHWAILQSMDSSALGAACAAAGCGCGRHLRHCWQMLRQWRSRGQRRCSRDLFGPIWLFFRGCGSLLVHAQRVRKEKGFAAACKASVHYLASGVRRNLKTLPRMAMYVRRCAHWPLW